MYTGLRRGACTRVTPQNTGCSYKILFTLWVFLREKRQDSGKSGILFILSLSLSLYFCLSRLSGRTSKDERNGCVSNHRRRDRFWTRDRGRINDSYAASVGVVWNSCSVPCLCQHQKFMHVVDSATLYPCLMKVPFIFLSLRSRFIVKI